MTISPIVQRAARVISRTHAETLGRFYVRAAQALADEGLLIDDPAPDVPHPSLFEEVGA